ncbi:MAG: hypothetical protein ACOCXL_03425 [Halanaerobium sp.]
MKAVIKGKLYDTESAEMIADWNNGELDSDVNKVIEELYLTKKGNYFLYKYGGLMLKYEGEVGIKPLKEEKDVKKWLEATKNAEAYIEHFDYEEA